MSKPKILNKIQGLNYSQARVREFANAVAILPRALRGSLNTPFIEFIVNGTKFATYENQDYFMQMSCTYAGVGNDPSTMMGGEGNKFSIQLVYMPKPSQNPNYIDELLSGVTADNKLCTLRFGYSGVPGYNLISSTYDCIITGYSVTLQNHYLYYSIECVSQGLIFREKRFTFIQQRDVDDPINFIYQCWGACGVDKYYDLVIDPDAYGHVEAMDIGFNYDANGNLIDNVNTLVDVTVFQFLTMILDNVTDTDDDHAIYWFELSDVSTRKAILIHRTIVTSEEDLSGVASFVFDWGGNHQDDSTNNLILGFEADYKGEVNIAVSENLIGHKYGINSSGLEVTAPGYFDYLVADQMRKEFTRDTRFWEKATTWAYTAQMELLGIPADIPIGAYIEVNPLIYGRKHHTAGVYMISGARCDISANGFRTNLTLMKVNIDTDNSKWWEEQRTRANNLYKEYASRFYINSSSTLSVRNDPTSIEATGLTFSGKDYVYMPVDLSSTPTLTYSYEEFDNNIPSSRETR